ncbi:MAG: hypothetical protein Kow0037_31050 [Calditrichia bacterium]
MLFSWLLVSFAQSPVVNNPKKQRPVLLAETRIEISHYGRTEAINKQLANFKYKVWSSTLNEQIEKSVTDFLQQEGYFLPVLDSARIAFTGDSQYVTLHQFWRSGPRFELALPNLRWQSFGGEDSLIRRDSLLLLKEIEPLQGLPYNRPNQQLLLARLVRFYEERGYPLCRVETGGFVTDSLGENRLGLHLNLHIKTGPQVKLKGILLPPKSDLDPGYFIRSFRMKLPELYREERIRRYHDILKRQDFIEEAETPQLVQESDSVFYLFLNFKESAATAFDGIVGYVPPPANRTEASGYFTGMVNLGLKNIFGTGRRFDVFWKKPDRHSEEFNVKYREPFLLGMPFHTSGMMHRTVRDTTYIEWIYQAEVELPLTDQLSAIAGVSRRIVNPDSLASRVLRYPRTDAIQSRFGLVWDRRNARLFPTSGFYFDIKLDYGQQKNIGPAYLIEEDSLPGSYRVSRISSSLKFYQRFFKNQVLAINLETHLVGYNGRDVQLPDMIWFGGARTIRGYRESQFFADRLYFGNFEYHFQLGPQSSLFVFSDVGYYSRNQPDYKEDILIGYGMGLRFPAPLGVMQVDYGLARGGSFQEGKLHVRIINDL